MINLALIMLSSSKVGYHFCSIIHQNHIYLNIFSFNKRCNALSQFPYSKTEYKATDKATNAPDHLAALQKSASYFQNIKGVTEGFSPCDSYAAIALDEILGETANTQHLITTYYDKLAAGTYVRLGTGDITLYSTDTLIENIRNSRASSGIGNLAAHDLGIGLAAADNLSDLAEILVSYQIDTGGFTWNSGFVSAGNEATQETSYAMLALHAFDMTSHYDAVSDANDWILSQQLDTGGWVDYPGYGGSEYIQIAGEVLWASGECDVPEPATIAGLLFAVIGLAGKRKFRTNRTQAAKKQGLPGLIHKRP